MKHLVTLHCGQQMWLANPHQKFCNRKCAGYFVSRRPDRKKRNGTGPVKKPIVICGPDSNDPAWNSAKRYLNNRGYIVLSFYDRGLKMAFSRCEHIIVWEKVHGEQVPTGWVIHHLNEVKDDNDPANLLALPRGLHRELHVELELMFEQCRGLEYLKRRHELTKTYIARSVKLTNLRRGWYGDN